MNSTLRLSEFYFSLTRMQKPPSFIFRLPHTKASILETLSQELQRLMQVYSVLSFQHVELIMATIAENKVDCLLTMERSIRNYISFETESTRLWRNTYS